MELNHIFLIILGVVAVVYLVTLFFKFGKFQATLKGLLVPLILAVYFSRVGVSNAYLPIVLALVFGWLGDVFLLKISDVRFFRIGLVSFLIGQICYIVAMYPYARQGNNIVFAVSVAVAVILGFLLYRLVRPNSEMKVPVIIYEVVIMLMAIFALQVFLDQGGLFGALVLAGSISFVISDSVLAFDTFRRKTNFGYFIVMLTYIGAQLLLTLGFCNI